MGEIKNKGKRFKSRTFPELEAVEGERFYYIYYKGKPPKNMDNKIPKNVLERDNEWEEITFKVNY